MRFISFFTLLLLYSFVSAQTDSSSNHEQEKIYTFVEQNPQFPAGNAALIDSIRAHLEYPQMEKDNHIEGTVLLRFIVNEDGSVSDITVTRKVSPGLDKEAVRIIKQLPRFIPGKQQGKLVKVYFPVPVHFKLGDEDKRPFPQGVIKKTR